MRTISAAQEAVLGLDHYAVRARVYVENSDGYYRNLCNLQAYDWVDEAEWDEDIDQPTAQAVVRLFRDVYQMSLSPLMEESKLNLDAASSYAPLLDLGRELLILTETAAIDTPDGKNMPIIVGEETPNDYATLTPNQMSGLWEFAFHGEIDDIDWAGNPISVTCRDLGGDLTDTFIETERSYGTAGGTAVEGEMQDILDDNSTSITLYTPASPSWNVKTWTQRKEPVLEALRRLAMQIGWDVRYKWRSSTGAFALTFYEPDRDKATPDRTFASSDYYEIGRLGINRAGIRNVVRVIYTDSSGVRQTAEVSDATSITNYGRRFMEIVEAAASQIDGSTEANAMATGALTDLKEPKAEQEVTMPYFWPVELGDLYRFSANDVHYSTNQDLAVIGFRHRITQTEQRTTLMVRGAPAGAYKQWLTREARPGVGKAAPLSGVTAPWVNNREGQADTGDIADNAVETDKLADNAVTDDSFVTMSSTAVITTTSTSFVELSDLAITANFVKPATALVLFRATVQNTDTAHAVDTRLNVDSVDHALSRAGKGVNIYDNTNVLVTSLSSGSHDFKVYWRAANAGTASSQARQHSVIQLKK